MSTLPVIHPSHSHWTREEMPQIADVALFEHCLRLHGIQFRNEPKTPMHLRATQNEINLKLVFKLIEAGLDTKTHPLIVSKDGHILDGHNRWYAALTLRIDVHCIVVDREIESLLRFALSLPNTKHSDIKDTKKH